MDNIDYANLSLTQYECFTPFSIQQELADIVNHIEKHIITFQMTPGSLVMSLFMR